MVDGEVRGKSSDSASEEHEEPSNNELALELLPELTPTQEVPLNKFSELIFVRKQAVEE